MKALIPPKTPLKLALYCFVIYSILNIAWYQIFHIQKGMGSVPLLLFALVGYAFGKHHGDLTIRRAWITCAYFFIPIFVFAILSASPELKEVPRNELGTLILVTLMFAIAYIGVQVIFSTFVLKAGIRFGIKQNKKKS
jgi:hypothetical protein